MLRQNLSHIHLNAPKFTPPACIIKDDKFEIINAAYTLLAIKNTSQATAVAFQGKLSKIRLCYFN